MAEIGRIYNILAERYVFGKLFCYFLNKRPFCLAPFLHIITGAFILKLYQKPLRWYFFRWPNFTLIGRILEDIWSRTSQKLWQQWLYKRELQPSRYHNSSALIKHTEHSQQSTLDQTTQ